MTDFRFHIVSLTAVFLALAVGIVLGSGPMRSAFVGELSDEVDTLRSQLADSEAQVAAERAQAVVGEQFVDESAARLIGEVLRDQRVALVTVHEVSQDALAAQRARVVEAGADVVATIELTDVWFDPDQAPFRAALADQLAEGVSGAGPADGPDAILSAALAQALAPTSGEELEGDTATDPDSVDGADAIDDSQVLFDVLADAQLIEGSLAADIDVVIVMAGSVPQTAGNAADEARVIAGLAGAVAERAAVVVAGGEPSQDGVTSAVANSAELSSLVSTVDAAHTFYGRLSVVLAAAQQLSGGVGAYAPGPATVFVPQIASSEQEPAGASPMPGSSAEPGTGDQ